MMTLAGMGVMTIIFSMQRSYTGLILVGIIYGAVSYLPVSYTHLEDQAPMIEQTREIVHKFNSVYDGSLVEPEILLPDNKACLRLPGIDGKAKMKMCIRDRLWAAGSYF